MQVQNVQNTPSFTGYVSKGLKKHINNLVKDACNETIQKANKNHEQADASQLFKNMEMGEYITNTLEGFMAKIHKNTVLDYTEPAWDTYFPLKLRNSKTKTSVYFREGTVHEPSGVLSGNAAVMSPEKFSNETLNGLATFATKLRKTFNPAEFDKFLFNRHVDDITSGDFNEIANFIRVRQAEKAEKMASEFGVKPDGIRFGVKRWIAQYKIWAKEDKMAMQQEKALKAQKLAEEAAKQERLEKSNDEIYKTLLRDKNKSNSDIV